ncbi:MAG: hypothetical protein ACTHJM_12600 [Marmoricola sp.]
MRFLRVLSVSLIALASLVVASPPGTAAGGYAGNLLLRSVGSVYAGPYAIESLVTPNGGSSTFAFEVQNTGTTATQFNVRPFASSSNNCGSSAGCSPVTYSITTGITKVVVGPNGFATPLIKPGGVATYSLKITPNITSAADDGYSVRLALYDPTGALLNDSFATSFVKATTGGQDIDQYGNGSGQPTLRAPASMYDYPYLSDAAVKSGQTSTFAIKLRNDSPSPARVTYTLSELNPSCAAYFAPTVKDGLTNITTAAMSSSGWITPVMAHGASISLNVSIKYLGNGRACSGWGYSEWQSSTMDSLGYTGPLLLFVNFAAGSS